MGQIGAQKRVGRQFAGEARGDGGAVFGAGGGDAGDAGVRGGVFVAREDRGWGGRGGQFRQAVPHRGGRAFEQAATAPRHQAVGGEGVAALGEVEGDVAAGAAGDG